MSYVPPALRSRSGAVKATEGGKESSSQTCERNDTGASLSPSTTIHTLQEIHAYFGHTSDDSNNEVGRPKFQKATLNVSPNQNHNAVGYIVLFKNQHPDWATQREIFCKSYLELLPKVTSPVDKGTLYP